MRRHSIFLILIVLLLGCAKDHHIADATMKHDAVVTQQPEPEAEEYVVYSTLIDKMHSRDESKSLVIIDQTTLDEQRPYDHVEALRRFSKQVPGGIAPEIINDLLEKNKQPRSLSNRFNVKVDCLFLSREEISGIFQKGSWNEFNAIYPKRSIIDFSRVGFNAEMNVALVYTSASNGLRAGAGYYVFLVKENDTWAIKHKVDVWVS